MATEIKVPEMGESVIEATVGRWLKQIGEPVKAGEALVELETDKVNVEVGAQQDGVLARIDHQAGETVSVGQVLGSVDSQAVSNGSPGQSEPAPAQADSISAQEQKQINKGTAPALPTEGEATPGAAVTPVARRMAEEQGVDLAQVPPSQGGRVTKQDVEAYIERMQAQAATPPAPESVQPARKPPSEPSAPPHEGEPEKKGDARPEERIRMTRRRQTIARRMLEAAQSTAMLTTFNEIDMSAVIDLRKRRRDSFKERFGVDLGFMPFFIKAVIGALKAFPYLNTELAASQPGAAVDTILLKKYYDIGIAVGSEEGLVVPVLRDADRLSFAQMEKAIRGFVDKVKASTLTLEDLRGGTFTITNGGVYGSLLSTPILNPPQVGILGMHRIQERPVVKDGQIVARSMMYTALSYDHRIVDGREAVQFLVRVKELVEDPEALLMS